MSLLFRLCRSGASHDRRPSRARPGRRGPAAVGVYAGKPADRPAIVRMLIAPGAPLAKFSAEDLAAPAVDPRTLIA